ncbi:MAG: Eco57I restriction-modification methylase domain-containing protein [Candidatus Poribacteria bacterium]|nr:Eco57I restriction-modification methylase domain-containing protein [Candidatus Poribacteria bacterium]
MPALSGIQKDIYENDWENYAYTYGPVIESSDPPTLFEDGLGRPNNRMVVAAVKYNASPNGIGRQDTAICARIFAKTTNANAALVFAYSVVSEDITEARLAICAGGKVNMTAAFDPECPLTSAKSALEDMLQVIQRQSANLTFEKLLKPLTVAPLRQQFYKDVAAWVGKLQQGKTLSQRQTILRHLIRVMFVWILKEENIIPPEIFEDAFIAKSMKDQKLNYHREVLSFLFHDRLNTADEQRIMHPNPVLNDAMNRAPFLNGSLFAEHDGDNQLLISSKDYWNTDSENPGLFTIFSRYHWTVDEHLPGESEQTLDPELLSNLFERLITPTETGERPPDRHPHGTYYTPADVVMEMVKDALTAAIREYAPSHITDTELLELFGTPNAPLPHMSTGEHNRLMGRINELRIFDPAVGSGAFLFSALIALKTALDKLNKNKSSRTTDIIKRQLFGQDKNPLAIQITRLRLFIAIKANEKDLSGNDPLPNLEARIICADTLETIAHSGWRPESAGGLDANIPGLMGTLTALAQNRSQWFDAHTEDEKIKVRDIDQTLRQDFQSILKNAGDFASQELKGFADFSLFHTQPNPALTDARLLFYENPWRGFDVVIGNPPYEALNKSMNTLERDNLSEHKLYQTIKAGDLYTLFCETSLALAKPDGGVVTMVVPFSISFGQKQQPLRDIFERYSQSINLRHYDNRPDTTFNASPTVKSQENRQRVTIVTGVLGNGIDTVIKSTGLQRWPAAERHQCLNQRLTTELPRLGKNVDLRISGQWPRIPTKEAAEMLQAIIKQKITIEHYKSDTGETLCFPKTAYQFIASIPKDSVSPRSESLFTVKDMDVLRLVMAALNGHIAFGWWWMYGDGFHLKPHDLTSLTIPNAWEQNPEPAIDIGQRLIEAIPECITEAKQQGGIWRNVNFYEKRDLIEELDYLHIESLGLPVEPLLTHLRIMRSNNSYNYWGMAQL